MLGSILGGVGLITGFLNNQQAGRNANRALGNQEALIRQQVQAMQERFRIAKLLEAQGYFNPEQAMAQATALNQEEEGRARANLAGAMRVSGYAKGDSEYRVRDDALSEKYRTARAAQKFQIARQVGSDYLNAFDPSYTSVANTGIQAYGQQAGTYMNQQSPLGGVVAGMAPYFQQQKQQPAFRMQGLSNAISRYRG